MPRPRFRDSPAGWTYNVGASCLCADREIFFLSNIEGCSSNGIQEGHLWQSWWQVWREDIHRRAAPLDRLARSSRDLLNILHDLKEGSCGFVSLGESWCDTTSDIGQLVVTIMSGIAEFERKLILSRTEAGIAKARANGKKFGRPSALDVGEKRKIAERYAAGETLTLLDHAHPLREREKRAWRYPDRL